MAAVRDRIEALGSTAIGIGPAADFQARRLTADGLPYALYLDPTMASFAALGVGKQSMAHFVFDLRAWIRYLRALRRVGRQGKITGRYSNVPGVTVVDASAEPIYLYRGTGIADYPPVADVLRVLSTIA